MLQVLIAISQKFYYRKEAWGYAKVIHKKRVEKQMDKGPRYLKQLVLGCPLGKKEMNKITPVFLQSCFQEICFQEAL